MIAERALLLRCQGETLVGILASPAVEQASGWGLVIVVGGPQVRTGSHRQFTLLARALAEAGHAVLRFDHRGMGDSTGEMRSFDALGDDIDCAISALHQEAPIVCRVSLLGLCDGASAALLYSGDSAGVDALCLLNPWVRGEASLARTHLRHYYARRLVDGAFWRKVVRGSVGLRQVRSFGEALRFSASRSDGGGSNSGHSNMSYQSRMAQAWRRFRGPILLALSSEDLTAREFSDHARGNRAWQGLLGRRSVRQTWLDGADHTLSNLSHRVAFEQMVCNWLSDAIP